jgi:hypothetical protein
MEAFLSSFPFLGTDTIVCLTPLVAVFAGVPWNRCQFHLQQNAQAYVPKQEMKAPLARIFHTE